MQFTKSVGSDTNIIVQNRNSSRASSYSFVDSAIPPALNIKWSEIFNDNSARWCIHVRTSSYDHDALPGNSGRSSKFFKHLRMGTQSRDGDEKQDFPNLFERAAQD